MRRHTSAPTRLGSEPQDHGQTRHSTAAGAAYGLAAYAAWGLVPLYYRPLKPVDPLEILAHRVLWSVVLLALLLQWRRQWPTVLRMLRRRRVLLPLLGTTALIGSNWGLFIYAIVTDQVLQASLGYFINPLISVLLGFVFLRERLTRWQTASVLLATAGVAHLTWSSGAVPGLALALALAFGFYGLLRKIAPVDAVVGLTVETGLLAPLALGLLTRRLLSGTIAFGTISPTIDGVLMLAGFITIVPLLWFTNAARRLRLATIGFMQYIAPTGQFLLAVFAFGEPFRRADLISFAVIWTALAVYSVDAARSMQRAPRIALTPPPRAAQEPPPSATSLVSDRDRT